MSTPILELNRVSKVIRHKKIIDNLSFQVNHGEIYGLLGPNGAGKTTTIRMIVGLMSVTDGKIRICGHDVQSNFEDAIRNVGGIVENPEMYRYLTGYQNLMHYARMVPGVDKSRIQEVIRLVRLENRIHDKVKKYSLGMRQRLGVAQALLHRPKLLILDEPTNGLDPAGIHELRDYLRHLVVTEHISVFVSSHLLSEMELLCDRVAIIQDGKLIEVINVNDFKNSDGEILTYRLELQSVNGESHILSLFDQYKQSVTMVPGQQYFYQIMIMREKVPGLIAFLTSNDVSLYSLQMVSPTLEQKFLEITGGGQLV